MENSRLNFDYDPSTPVLVEVINNFSAYENTYNPEVLQPLSDVLHLSDMHKLNEIASGLNQNDRKVYKDLAYKHQQLINDNKELFMFLYNLHRTGNAQSSRLSYCLKNLLENDELRYSKVRLVGDLRKTNAGILLSQSQGKLSNDPLKVLIRPEED